MWSNEMIFQSNVICLSNIAERGLIEQKVLLLLQGLGTLMVLCLMCLLYITLDIGNEWDGTLSFVLLKFPLMLRGD